MDGVARPRLQGTQAQEAVGKREGELRGSGVQGENVLEEDETTGYVLKEGRPGEGSGGPKDGTS